MAIILHAGSPSREFLRRVEDAFGLDVVRIVDVNDDEAIRQSMPQAEVLLHVLRPVTRDMIAAAPKLKLIQKIGVGVNTIDLAAAKEYGVAVCNMPGSNSRPVAERALGLMLAVLQRLATYDRLMKAGHGWDVDPDLVDSIGEIGGRTVGLVGMGHVAGHLAPVLQALGANVIYHARNPHPELAYEFVSLQALLERSDIVSLHVPLTDATRQMMNAEAFARMPRGAIFINTARGGLVDEDALAEALSSGRLRGAGLDVFAQEPVDPANPLLGFEQLLCSPHIAWHTPETLARSMEIAAENGRRALAGEELLYRVV